MKREKITSPIYFYSLLALLFLLDVGSFLFFERPLIYSVLCLYIITCIHNGGPIRVALGMAALLLQSFIYFGRFGAPLATLIPITLAGLQARHVFYHSRWIYYLLLLLALLLQIVVVEHLILHLAISIPCTISQIFANMIMMIFIRSLLARLR
jgi:hypothetical protein